MGWTNWLCVPKLGLRFEMNRNITADNYTFVKEQLDKLNTDREYDEATDIFEVSAQSLTVGQLAAIVSLAQIGDRLKDYGDFLVEYCMWWSFEKRGYQCHVHDGGKEKMNEDDYKLKAIEMNN